MDFLKKSDREVSNGEKVHLDVHEDSESSVKIFLDVNSPLFVSSSGSNFIYRIFSPAGYKIGYEIFKSSISARLANTNTFGLKEKIEVGGRILFEGIQSEILFQNLRLIDGDLPSILAYSLLYKYCKGLDSWDEVIAELNHNNPLAYRLTPEVPVYEIKLGRFLLECALGMGKSPNKPWNGAKEIEKDIIIVESNGESHYYPLDETNRLYRYLLNSTRLEQPSTGEDGDNSGHIRIYAKTEKPKKPFLFGSLYKENNNYYFKINLQVRFSPLE